MSTCLYRPHGHKYKEIHMVEMPLHLVSDFRKELPALLKTGHGSWAGKLSHTPQKPAHASHTYAI